MCLYFVMSCQRVCLTLGSFAIQKWPTSAKNHQFDLHENQINRHVSRSKKQNLKAQLDDWNLNAGISEPITSSFWYCGSFSVIPQANLFWIDEILKMVSLPVRITANLLFQYIGITTPKTLQHLSEGITVEVSERSMTLRFQSKSFAAPLLHCCTSQGWAVN